MLGARPRKRPLLFLEPTDMNAIVYVDGFNLYYGALKNTPYKWLNLSVLCNNLLPKFDILNIKYYTARVKSRLTDPGQHVRQQTYLRALQTVPNQTTCDIHEAHSPGCIRCQPIPTNFARWARLFSQTDWVVASWYEWQSRCPTELG